LKMGKLASAARLLWDNGWHGGNSAKSVCPADHEPDAWTGCGECGLPDSQNHWLRVCIEESLRVIRFEAKATARDQLEAIQVSKGSRCLRDEIFNACSYLIETAFKGDGGVQLWLGIMPGPVVQTLTPHLSTQEYPSYKMEVPNKWRHSIEKILLLLVIGAIKMRKIKEEHQCQKLMGMKIQGIKSRQETRRRSRHQGIRVLYRRGGLRLVKRGNHDTSPDIDTAPCHLLLNDYKMAPIMATKRLHRIYTVRVLKSRRKKKHRWIFTQEQEYFSRNRNHSYKLLK